VGGEASIGVFFAVARCHSIEQRESAIIGTNSLVSTFALTLELDPWSAFTRQRQVELTRFA